MLGQSNSPSKWTGHIDQDDTAADKVGDDVFLQYFDIESYEDHCTQNTDMGLPAYEEAVSHTEDEGVRPAAGEAPSEAFDEAAFASLESMSLPSLPATPLSNLPDTAGQDISSMAGNSTHAMNSDDFFAQPHRCEQGGAYVKPVYATYTSAESLYQPTQQLLFQSPGFPAPMTTPKAALAIAHTDIGSVGVDVFQSSYSFLETLPNMLTARQNQICELYSAQQRFSCIPRFIKLSCASHIRYNRATTAANASTQC